MNHRTLFVSLALALTTAVTAQIKQKLILPQPGTTPSKAQQAQIDR